MSLQPPPLRNDCFAMPQGAHWTPVEDALAHLRANLKPICGTEGVALEEAQGRLLAGPVLALRAHPPHANAAVDGYAMAGAIPQGPQTWPLAEGRSAAGAPFKGTVPTGHALRILTGADIPRGTDTVIMQEDVATDGASIVFHGPLNTGTNVRKAGEDITKGATILPGRHRLSVGDLAMMASAGVGLINVRKRLRVGVLSTGDELINPGAVARPGQIYDANRPMLCTLLRGWGYDVVDLGIAKDDRDTIEGLLDEAAKDCNVILTSGGASAGDEDHISALLEGTGSLAMWRVAIKPGRPLALGLWNNRPVFGLPGNPVAAMVCALIFARPALALLAGGVWADPVSYQLPAAFSKSKKAGRHEYLRARISPNGSIEIFGSEGSGRVSGLSWARGLVALDDSVQEIAPGDPVTYLPFSALGL